MSEATQYAFDLKEVGIMLIKQKEIHSGLWDVSFDLTISVGVMGPAPETAFPTAMVQVTKALLMKHADGLPPAATTIDAAIVNPSSRAKKAPARSKKLNE